MIPVASAFRPGHKTLIIYLTAGYPSRTSTLELVPALVEAGCDAVELGIPFSDPLADGSTIQRASFAALEQGVNTATCLEIAATVSPLIDAPLLFMGYYNPMLQYGLQPFCQACANTGVSGLIVPDLPPEESGELRREAAALGVSLVFLVAPTTPDDRLAVIARHGGEFLYLVSLAGVTGARDSLPSGLEDFVGRVRRTTTLPLAVGFGISTPAQAARVARVADGVIVGSALLTGIENAVASGQDPVCKAAEYIRHLRTAIDSV